MHPGNRKTTLNLKRFLQSAGTTLCALILLLVCAAQVPAITLAQYRERLHRAVLLLNALASDLESGAKSGDETSAEFAAVQALLPAVETVEDGTDSWQVNNQWLHQALSECQKTPADPQRAEKLKRIVDQLQALGVRLNELESAAATDSGGKDKNKLRLEEILRRSEYQKKTREGGALGRLWQRLMKWLNGILPQPKPLSPGSGAATISSGAQIFVIILALAVIAYVVWKVAPSFLRNRKPRKRDKRKARIVLGEKLEPDQTAGDLLAEAESLARAGDLRAAIRKAYIALLCELGDRKIIRLAQYKTNRDYLSAVREIAPLHEEMKKLTGSFESHWYGFVPATETEWASFRNGYHRAIAHQPWSGQ